MKVPEGMVYWERQSTFSLLFEFKHCFMVMVDWIFEAEVYVFPEVDHLWLLASATRVAICHVKQVSSYGYGRLPPCTCTTITHMSEGLSRVNLNLITRTIDSLCINKVQRSRPFSYHAGVHVDSSYYNASG